MLLCPKRTKRLGLKQVFWDNFHIWKRARTLNASLLMHYEIYYKKQIPT